MVTLAPDFDPAYAELAYLTNKRLLVQQAKDSDVTFWAFSKPGGSWLKAVVFYLAGEREWAFGLACLVAVFC